MAQVQKNERVIDVYLGAMSMLCVTGINHYYGSSHTLRGVSLEIAPGECRVLLGHNGGRKDDAAQVPGASAVGRERHGHVRGSRHHETETASARRCRHRLCTHAREIVDRLTVEENLLMGVAATSGAGALRIDQEVYELFPLLKQMVQRRGGDPSGGQHQAIARALPAQSKLVIFDEPTKGIRLSIIEDIARVIRLLKQRGDMGILLCEQYFDVMHARADRFIVLSRGRATAAGTRPRWAGRMSNRTWQYSLRMKSTAAERVPDQLPAF